MSKFRIFLSYFFCLLFQYAQAQAPIAPADKPIELPILVFENPSNGDIKFVKQGGGVLVQLRSNPKTKVKGMLESIDNQGIVVQGTRIEFSDCAAIKAKVRTDKQMYGGMLLGLGATGLAIGGALAGNSAGYAILGAGLASFTGGLIFITGKKRFNLNKSWQVRAGKITYQP